MKLFTLFVALLIALFAFDADISAGCCGGSSGGAGLFGRGGGGLFRPFSRMRSRMADRRMARSSNASFNATYTQRVTGFSNNYSYAPSPAMPPVPPMPTEFQATQAVTPMTGTAPVAQAPPARIIYQTASPATGRVVTSTRMNSRVSLPSFGFYASGCANGNCPVAR